MIEFLLTIAGTLIGVALFLYVNKRLRNRANKRLTMIMASSYFAFGLLCMLVSFFIEPLLPLLCAGLPIAICGILSVVRVHMMTDFH